MWTKLLVLILSMISVHIFAWEQSSGQEVHIKSISDHVFIVSHQVLGDQSVVKTKKGLMVFDSFWSEKSAREFKEAISKAFNRDDFSHVINMTDRLDFIGGNKAYTNAVIVGHEYIPTKYRSDEAVETELKELIEFWRGAEESNQNRLNGIEEGSEQKKETLNWIEQCSRRYKELESGYSLLLPQITYSDRMTLNLDDITINLIWFGETGNYRGLTMAVIPEEKVAILSRSIINPSMHLGPYPQPDFAYLNVPRWIASFEEILEGEKAVDTIIFSDYDLVISREKLHKNLEYIRRLWNRVKSLENEGMDLEEIQDRLSFDKIFYFVKEMPLYINRGDGMTRFQHNLHIMLFFLQGKTLASKFIEDGGIDFLQVSLKKIRELRDHGEEIYFHEMYLNRIAYVWMNMGKYSEAIEVLKLAIEALPKAFNLYDSLGEAYLKIGDKMNAIENFKRSLELNPNNDNAKKMLEQLQKK